VPKNEHFVFVFELKRDKFDMKYFQTDYFGGVKTEKMIKTSFFSPFVSLTFAIIEFPNTH
jgi:hypothetical protein